MLWITIVMIALAIIVTYLAITGGRLWKQYLTDVKSSLDALFEIIKEFNLEE
jgi:ABC-type transporter Mla maintaining outer membrane lipid asymmetry permease subunit MlaE